jgi:ankyrin repeat protein
MTQTESISPKVGTAEKVIGTLAVVLGIVVVIGLLSTLVFRDAFLAWSCDTGKVGLVRVFLGLGADPNAKTQRGMDLLMQAASQGHTGVISALIQAGAKVDARDCTGWTCLFHATAGGHPVAVAALINLGANPVVRDRYGRTALRVAFSREKVDVADRKLVISTLVDAGIRVNDADDDGITPLMASVSGDGQPAVIQVLIDHGADVNARSVWGWTALMDAVTKDKPDLINLLLDQGADISARTRSGFIPLIIAARRGKLLALKILMERGALQSELKMDYATAILLAVHRQMPEVVKQLCLQSHRYGPETFEVKTLFAPSKKDLLATAKLIYSEDSEIQRQLPIALLTYAPYEGNLGLVRFLLEKGVNVNDRLGTGWTALMSALVVKNDKTKKEMVNLLLEKGADVNLQDNTGQTPLFLAMREGDTESIRSLLGKLAVVEARDHSGASVLQVARAKADELGELQDLAPRCSGLATDLKAAQDVVKILEKRGAVE